MAVLDPGATLSTFALIVPAELPDKTFIATLILATRFRHLPVWLGVSAAFFVQTAIAVSLGGLLSLLPRALVAGVAAVIFAAGAAILFKGAMKSRQAATVEAQALVAAEEEAITKAAMPTSAWKMATTSFVVLFVAEWGDLSQLLTASQSARTGEPISVFIGAWLALVLVAGLAVLAGRWIFSTVPLHRVRFISAGVLAVLAGSAIAEVFVG